MSPVVLWVARLGTLTVLGTASPALAQLPGFGEAGENRPVQLSGQIGEAGPVLAEGVGEAGVFGRRLMIQAGQKRLSIGVGEAGPIAALDLGEAGGFRGPLAVLTSSDGLLLAQVAPGETGPVETAQPDFGTAEV